MANKYDELLILVVHDTPPLRNLLIKMIQSFGFKKILSAANEKNALLILERQNEKNEPVDLIISDWHMPAMTGPKLLEKARAIDSYKSTPFLVVTSGISKEETVDAIKAGVTDFIMNPVRADHLLEKIVKCIKLLKKNIST